MAENFKNLMKDLKVTDSRSLVNNKKKTQGKPCTAISESNYKTKHEEKKS